MAHLKFLTCYGHGGIYDVEVNEGVFPDRIWDVQLMDIAGLVGQKVCAEAKHQDKLVEALRNNPEGLSKKKLREIAGLNNPNAVAAIEALLSANRITVVDSTHGGNKTKIQTYKLVDIKTI